MNSPKKLPPTKRQPSLSKSACLSKESLLDHPAKDEGFFLSPLNDDLSDEDVRKLWRSGSRTGES